MKPEELRERAALIQAAGDSSPVLARDPVNLPMINNWVEAIGDNNPIYVDAHAARSAGHRSLVAPPTMIQVWTYPGMQPPPPDDRIGLTFELLDEAGYTAVVATNMDQTYHRYVEHGERLSAVSALDDLTGPKRTSLGTGWFMTTRHTWYSGDEVVGKMRFRMLKYVAPPDRSDSQVGDAAPPRIETGGELKRADSPAVAGIEERLPEMTIEVTPTFIISTAMATRDFQDVHHDRDRAIAHGSKDIFLNIDTDAGLVQRFVTDWFGPQSRLTAISLRLLVPSYAYDSLLFRGEVTAMDGAEATVAVVGRGQLGDHVVGAVRISNSG
jgi:hypothetical protein